MRHFRSRSFIVGGFAGVVLVLSFLAACGGGGTSAVAQAMATALSIQYDHTASGMAADNVQAALDELDGRVDTNETNISGAQTALGTLDTTSTEHGTRIGDLETTSDDHEARIGMLETDSTDHGTRITTLENATVNASGVAYSNSSSGLSSTDAQAAIDEIVSTAAGGSTFIRWGNTNAPSGTTKLYDGIAMAPADGKIIVVKGGDAGSSVSEGGQLQFLATDTTSSRMPSGITANRRIVACVCFSSKPTAILWGTHTAPSGWSVLYTGYAMNTSTDVIVVDSDNFDASAGTAGSESNRELVQARILSTHDSTNYPSGRNIKACVVQKN